MLVLTRKVDESIIIGDDINIMILGLSPSQVKIGITAPKTFRILRKEVYDTQAEEADTSTTDEDAETSTPKVESPPQKPETHEKQPEATGAQ